MKREAITIRHLCYTYPDGTKVLEDVSLEVYEGERIAIVGPNGAGKTTFLLHLNGILRGSDGQVEVFGKSVDKVKREEITKEVGIVFQDPDDQLFMPTLFDDLAFGPINMGLKENEVRERVEKTILSLGLTGYENRSPHHLSGGEKKKAALAAVMSMEPRILVLDEPTANLDPRSRAELIASIKRLNEEEGITIVIATHDVNAVPELVDRVYVLNKRIIAEGTIQKIFSDVELLKENNLEVPEVFKLFEVLKCFGYNCEELPLSINEAIEHLTRTVETEGGHIHLHIHEHTHEEVRKLKCKYEHHWD
nr:putative cobalt import ATP-binding protein [uncultured archaeon]CBH39363.1 putative cobalt import ATP-binding protein [uncultured archaeon]